MKHSYWIDLITPYSGPINLKPLQGLKHNKKPLRGEGLEWPNQPQTLTGIETKRIEAVRRAEGRPNQPQTLTGIETKHNNWPHSGGRGPINLKPLQGLKHFHGTSWNFHALGPNQPQTLTGIETLMAMATATYGWGPINLKPLQGLKHSRDT